MKGGGLESLDNPLWFPIAVFTNEKFLYGPFVRTSDVEGVRRPCILEGVKTIAQILIMNFEIQRVEFGWVIESDGWNCAG